MKRIASLILLLIFVMSSCQFLVMAETKAKECTHPATYYVPADATYMANRKCAECGEYTEPLRYNSIIIGKPLKVTLGTAQGTSGNATNGDFNDLANMAIYLEKTDLKGSFYYDFESEYNLKKLYHTHKFDHVKVGENERIDVVISVSSDAQVWKEAGSFTIVPDGDKSFEIDLTGHTARYIKYDVTLTNPKKKEAHFQVAEIEVLGESADGIYNYPSFTNKFTNINNSKIGYVLGGREIVSGTYVASDFIEGTAGKTVNFGMVYPNMDKSIPVIECYDKDKKFIKDVYFDDIDFEKVKLTESLGSYKLPTGTKYFKVNVFTLYKNDFLVSVGEKMDKKEYNLYHSRYNVDVRFDSPLLGRSALFCGDSICSGLCERGSTKHPEFLSWGGRIGTYNNMIYRNAGIDGRTIGQTSWGEGAMIYHEFANDTNQYDFIILEGGVNDAWAESEIGTISAADNFTEFDITTFAGGLEYYFKTLKEKFPNSIIGYIICFDTKNATAGPAGIRTMSGYWEQARLICQKWNIPYLDLYSNEQVTKDLHINESDWGEYIYDGIHPTYKGFEVIYPVIEKWMEDLFIEKYPNGAPTVEMDTSLIVRPSQFGPMENWNGSANKGEEATVFQLLVGVFDKSGALPAPLQSASTKYMLTLTGSDGSTANVCMPYSTKVGYTNSTFADFVRFETVLQPDGNQWIPTPGVKYTLEISVMDSIGNIWNGKSAEGAFACSEGFYATVPDAYKYPSSTLPEMPDSGKLQLAPASVAFENWTGSPNKGDSYDVLEMNVLLKDAEVDKVAGSLMDTSLIWKLEITGSDGFKKTINIKSSTPISNDNEAGVRFEPVLQEEKNQFVPIPGVGYTVKATVTDKFGVEWVGESEEFAFFCPVDLIASLPDKYVYDSTVIPEIPYEASFKLTPSPYGAMENWTLSPNKGTDEAVYQLLVTPRDLSGRIPSSLLPTDNEWTLKITGSDGSEKTIKLKPATSTDNLVRFETLLTEEDNKWAPKAGVKYTVEATITDSLGINWSGKSDDGAFACPEGFVAAAPTPAPVTPTPEPTPTPTPTPTPDVTPTPDLTPSVTPPKTPSETPTPSVTPEVSETEGTATPDKTNTPDESQEPDNTLLLVAIITLVAVIGGVAAYFVIIKAKAKKQ